MSEGSTPARCAASTEKRGRTTATAWRQSSWIATASGSAAMIALASSASRRSTAGSGPRKAASIFLPPPRPSMNFHTFTLASGKAASSSGCRRSMSPAISSKCSTSTSSWP